MTDPALLILSGFAGAGKDTVLHHLFRIDERFAPSVSVCTRKPRAGEVDGVDYYFRTREEFDRLLKEEAFLEHAEFCGNCYGTPKSEIERNRSRGKITVLEIDTAGALQVMQLVPEHISVFLSTPDFATLEARLRGRGSETADTLRLRLEQARREQKLIPHYAHVLVNPDGRSEDVAKTVSELFFRRPLSYPELCIPDIKQFAENF